jgi:hypothetical protein
MALFETTGALAILMTGLMTHMGEQQSGTEVKTHVVLVKEQNPAHAVVPYAVFRVMDVDTSSGPPPTEFVRSGNYYLYEFQDRDEVEFSGGVSPGDAKPTPAFDQYTISLRRPLTNGSINPKPKSKAKNDRHHNVFAKLFYPKGGLGIAYYHPVKASFPFGGPASDCVPRVTAFVAETTANIAMTVTHENGQTTVLKLKPTALVGIYNQHDGGHAFAKEHFLSYMGILVPSAVLGLMAPDEGGTCGLTPQLPPNISAVGLLAAYASQHGLAAGSSPAVAAHGSRGLDMVLSDHPACTNTDYP